MLPAADEQLLRELTERARTGGLKLAGEGGLLGKLTKMVVESAREGELMIAWVMARMTRRAVMAAIVSGASHSNPRLSGIGPGPLRVSGISSPADAAHLYLCHPPPQRYGSTRRVPPRRKTQTTGNATSGGC